MSLKRKFASDVLFYSFSSGLVGLSGLITLPILTKNLSPDLYGAWAQIGVTIALLLTFVTLGFQASVIRFLSGNKDKHKISSLFHLMLIIIIINSFIFLSITFFFQNILSGFIFADNSFRYFVPLAGLWLMVQSIYILNISFLRSRNKIKLLSLINISRTILKIIILYLILIVFTGNLVTVIKFYIIIDFIFSLSIYFFEVAKSVGISVKLYYLKNELKALLKFSLPLMPNSALMWILASSDRYFIVHLLSLSDNAIYSVAYRLVSILSLFYMPFGFVAYPLLVEFWEKNQKNKVREILEKSIKVYMFIIIPSIFGLYAFGSKVILMLTTKNYSVPPTLILWVSLGILFLGIYQINVYTIHLIKKTYYNTIIFSIAATVNIILNYFFIKAIGIEGAAISTFISYLFLASVVTILARKKLNYNFDIKFMVKSTFASLIMFTVIRRIVVLNLFMVLLNILLGAIIYLLLMIILRCFNQEDRKDIRHILGFN